MTLLPGFVLVIIFKIRLTDFTVRPAAYGPSVMNSIRQWLTSGILTPAEFANVKKGFTGMIVPVSAPAIDGGPWEAGNVTRLPELVSVNRVGQG